MTLIEHLRKEMIEDLFTLKSFVGVWDIWEPQIRKKLVSPTPQDIVNLGDHLSEIFMSTSKENRDQGEVASGGAAWEALICWYLNLCLVNTRTVVFKFKKKFIPTPVKEALTVKYDTFPSTTESDLIAITFPDKASYNKLNLSQLSIYDNHGKLIKLYNNNNEFQAIKALNQLIVNDFSNLRIDVIQCKTNWNDNSQIPMLWDMVYASDGFYKRNITVGSSLYSLRDIDFSYAFVTVPTNKKSKYKPTSTPVKRVQNISGGNYWGKASEAGVSNSVKEMLNRNFSKSSDLSIRDTLSKALDEFDSKFAYFNLNFKE